MAIKLDQNRQKQMNGLATLLTNATPKTKIDKEDINEFYTLLGNNIYNFLEKKGLDSLAMLFRTSGDTERKNLDMLFHSANSPGISLSHNLKGWGDTIEKSLKETEKMLNDHVKQISKGLYNIQKNYVLSRQFTDKDTEYINFVTILFEKINPKENLADISSAMLQEITNWVIPETPIILIIREKDDLKLEKQTAHIKILNSQKSIKYFAVLEVYSGNSTFLSSLNLDENLTVLEFIVKTFSEARSDCTFHWTILKAIYEN